MTCCGERGFLYHYTSFRDLLIFKCRFLSILAYFARKMARKWRKTKRLKLVYIMTIIAQLNYFKKSIDSKWIFWDNTFAQ